MTSSTLEHLEEAPIDEVACGIVFAPLAELDPLVVGSYWRERSTDYPGHGVRAQLRDPFGLVQFAGPLVPPIRSMLTSRDDQYVVQVLADRFYFNWRRRKAGYPRFSGEQGVLALAIREYGLFDAFCLATLGRTPELTGIELAKIDVIREGAYWEELHEIGELLPCLRDFVGFTRSDRPSFVLRFTEPRERGVVQISIALGESRPDANRVLTLETRIQKDLDGGPMESTFRDANIELNEVFAALIPKEQRQKYFKGRGNK